MTVTNNAKKLTGKERVYKVTFSYQKRYVNSWDILHRRTSVREEFVNTTASLYVLASTKKEVSDILNSDENFVDLKIVNIEKQPSFISLGQMMTRVVLVYPLIEIISLTDIISTEMMMEIILWQI